MFSLEPFHRSLSWRTHSVYKWNTSRVRSVNQEEFRAAYRFRSVDISSRNSAENPRSGEPNRGANRDLIRSVGSREKLAGIDVIGVDARLHIEKLLLNFDCLSHIFRRYPSVNLTGGVVGV